MAVSSIQAHNCHARLVWQEARAALGRAADHNQCLTDRQTLYPSPGLHGGQTPWLSSRDLPLQTDSRKLSPRFIDTYPIDHVIHPTVDHLKLSTTGLPHLSCLPPETVESPLNPPADPSPPPQIIDNHPAYSVSGLLEKNPQTGSWVPIPGGLSGVRS